MRTAIGWAAATVCARDLTASANSMSLIPLLTRPIRWAGTKMEKCACRPTRGTGESVTRAGDHTIEQTENHRQLRCVVDRGDEVHFLRARVCKANIDTTIN